jgi:hypothetical protein
MHTGESPAGDADGAEVAHYFLIFWLLAIHLFRLWDRILLDGAE